MGIAIVLRKQLPINRFREYMIGVIQTGSGTNALLCSGFFQENINGSEYRVTEEHHFAEVVANQKLILTTIGIYNNTWLPSYRNFIMNMRARGVILDARYINRLRWHAKVFILSRNDESIFGVIGSSNMTRPAFGSVGNFNYECDVFLWSDRNDTIVQYMDTVLAENNYPMEIIRAPYNADLNKGIQIEDRMDDIKNEILSLSTKSIE